MMQPELFARLRLLAEAYRIPFSGPADRVNEIAPPTAVRQVLAEVEARLPDGRFRVLAAGQKFDVLLPPATQPGDRVRIALSTLGSSPPAVAIAAAADAGEGAVRSELSAAGRLALSLAPGPGGERAGAERPPGTIAAARPLLPDAPINVSLAASTLRELVALSGLFYESHQAEWVSGERSREQMLREPQARLPPLPAARAPDVDERVTTTAVNAGAPVTTTPATAPPALHPEAVPLVQQQLNALEARHILWSGQIWPGQPMRWEIEETGDETPGARETEGAHAWTTRIDLALPRLGALSAVLTLGSAGLQVRLSAQQETTGTLFAQQLHELQAALGAAGLKVAAMAAVPHGNP